MKSKRSRDEWNELVNNYKISGLSINRYCRGNDLKPSTFIYWKKKFDDTKSENLTGLVKVSVPIESNEKMKLVFNKVTFEFPVDFSIDKISKLISVIKEV